MKKRNLLEEFKIRGILKDISNEEKVLNAAKTGAGIYIGFDPTANSMHIGHLIQIMLLKRFQEFGLKPIIIIGGGTGKIGDPSFKKDERPLLDDKTINKNVEGMKKQFLRLLPNLEIVNNAEWLNNQLMTDFLRDVGKRFTLSYLLAKDCISSRIEKGLSITEFFYTMLQGYDFYNLYSKYNCFLQCGGSDQWGNITSGLDLINSYIGRENSKAAGLTTNLLTKKNGQKFGKTESGAIWLDKNKTSNYEFYQFFLNQDDDDAFNQLMWLSSLQYEEIIKLKEEAIKDPRQRLMQKHLAKEVTEFVRGKEGYNDAIKVTEALFNNDIKSLSEDNLKTLSGIPSFEIEASLNIIDFLTKSTICPSNRESRLMIKDKSVSVNGIVIDDENQIVDSSLAFFSKYFIVKKGKRNFFKVVIK